MLCPKGKIYFMWTRCVYETRMSQRQQSENLAKYLSPTILPPLTPGACYVRVARICYIHLESKFGKCLILYPNPNLKKCTLNRCHGIAYTDGQTDERSDYHNPADLSGRGIKMTVFLDTKKSRLKSEVPPLRFQRYFNQWYPHFNQWYHYNNWLYHYLSTLYHEF